MSVPEGVTPAYNQLIVIPYFGAGFGIRGNTPDANVGSVYKIGSNCYRISVNQKIGFLKTTASFITDSGQTFTVVSEDAVKITYQAIP